MVWDACTLEPNPVIRWIECHPGSAGWLQAGGALIGIAVAITVPLLLELNRRTIEHRVAEVVIASALRSWLRIAAYDVEENLRFVGTGGEDGERNVEMPKFVVATDQIAKMRPRYAREVLSLIERRERRQNRILTNNYYVDNNDGLMSYYEEIGHLFWSVRRIYREIALVRGLDEYTNTPAELDTIRNGQTKAETYRALENRSI